MFVVAQPSKGSSSKSLQRSMLNRPFSYSAKEPGSSVVLYTFIHEIRSSGVRASITVVHVRKFYQM